jgi:putative flippase GtrA
MTPASTTDVAVALASPSSVAAPLPPDPPSRGPRLLRELAAFGVVGLIAFVVDLGTFNAARHLLDVGPLSAKTTSVVLATTVAFAGNREWTFRDRGRAPAGRQYVLFFLLNGVALLIALACLGVTYYVLGLRSPLAENISANGVGLVLGTAFRFWAYRRWVFRPGCQRT